MNIANVRNGLIDKIRTINNPAFLEALDAMISASSFDSDVVGLTSEQKAVLEMSEQDIEQGNLISQEVMDKRNLEWLSAM
ncbi:MAG: hypothetical protein ACK5LR_04770 [Mangrovibacterium sp.]